MTINKGLAKETIQESHYLYDALVGKDEGDLSVWKEKDLQNMPLSGGKKKEQVSEYDYTRYCMLSYIYFIHTPITMKKIT